jgi:hypothetical protein
MHRPYDISHRIARILEGKANAEDEKALEEDPELADPGGVVIARLDQCPVCLGKTKLRCTEQCYRCLGQGVVQTGK